VCVCVTDTHTHTHTHTLRLHGEETSDIFKLNVTWWSHLCFFVLLVDLSRRQFLEEIKHCSSLNSCIMYSVCVHCILDLQHHICCFEPSIFKLFCNEVICISLCSKATDDFTAEIPAVRFIDNGTNLQCTLMLCNSHSYKTSELLSKYASINEDVRVLGVVFRLWAQVSTSIVHVV